MKKSTIVLSLMLTLPLLAQAPRFRRVPVNTGPEAVQIENAFKENIAIRLNGTTTTGSEIDLTLTGIGPKFSADQMVGDDGSVLRCEYLVESSDAEYLVSYTISVRIREATQGNKESTYYSYRDVSIKGTVRCRVDEPVTILKNGDKPLCLTISKMPNKRMEGDG